MIFKVPGKKKVMPDVFPTVVPHHAHHLKVCQEIFYSLCRPYLPTELEDIS
jgi:hypothetical protein